jgi:hypothetical protein
LRRDGELLNEVAQLLLLLAEANEVRGGTGGQPLNELAGHAGGGTEAAGQSDRRHEAEGELRHAARQAAEPRLGLDLVLERGVVRELQAEQTRRHRS